MPNKSPLRGPFDPAASTGKYLTLARRLVYPEDLNLQLKLKLLNIQNSKFS
jgi:hypothetical protein